MPYISAWFFPMEGRQKRIVRSGYPKEVILNLIHDGMKYGYISSDDLIKIVNGGDKNGNKISTRKVHT